MSKLKQLRQDAHLTQQQLAKLVGVDPSLISLLERNVRRGRGRRGPGHDIVVGLARALKCKPEDLFPVARHRRLRVVDPSKEAGK